MFCVALEMIVMWNKPSNLSGSKCLGKWELKKYCGLNEGIRWCLAL